MEMAIHVGTRGKSVRLLFFRIGVTRKFDVFCGEQEVPAVYCLQINFS